MSEQERDDLITNLQFAYILAQEGDSAQAQAILAQYAGQVDDLLAQADVALYSGLITRHLGDLTKAAAHLTQAQANYEAAGDTYQAGVSVSYRGQVATEQGYPNQAIEYHYLALQHFLKIAELQGIGNELARIGLILDSLYRRQEAFECFQQALEAHQAAGEQRSLLLDHLNLSSMAEQLGHQSLAQEHAQAAKFLAVQLDDPAGKTRANYLLANLASDAGKVATALKLYTEAQRQAKLLSDQKFMADITLGIGLTHYRAGDLIAAGESLGNAFHAYLQLHNIEGQATSLGNLGLVHLANGDLDKAEGCFEAAIELHQKRGDEISTAEQKGNLGLVLRNQGRWPEAEQMHRQASQLLEQAGDTIGQATQLVNLASLAYLRGDLKEAKDRYKQSLLLYQTADYVQGKADVLANLGNVAHAHARWETALSYYQQALELYHQIGHRRGEAGVLANIGVIYRELGQWEEAIRNYEQAIELDRAATDRPGEAATLNNLGLTRRLMGDFTGALTDLDRALTLYQAIGDKRGQAATLNNIGFLHLRAGQPTQAVEYHQQALDVYQSLGLRAGLISCLGNLANASADLGQLEQALDHFDQALVLAHQIDDPDAKARLRVGRGEVYDRLGRSNEAVAEYEVALELIEAQRLDLTLTAHRESFMGRERQTIYRRLIKLLVRQGATWRAWQVCEQSRSRTFLDQLAQSRWPRPASIDDTWWKEVNVILDQIRLLANDQSVQTESISKVTHKRRAVLVEARNQLQHVLTNAPASASSWVNLLYGQPISASELCGYLTMPAAGVAISHLPDQ